MKKEESYVGMTLAIVLVFITCFAGAFYFFRPHPSSLSVPATPATYPIVHNPGTPEDTGTGIQDDIKG